MMCPKNGAKLAWTAVALALALSLAACNREASPAKGTGNGTVAAVSTEKNEITLDHGEIPGVMGAMVMTFAVSDPAVLRGVTPGAKVEFDVEMRSGEPVVTAVRPRP